MAQEFYIAMRREVELYQERVKHFIDTNITSPAVMNRWIAETEVLEKILNYSYFVNKQMYFRIAFSRTDGSINWKVVSNNISNE